MLETHDDQSDQYSIRQGKSINVEDRELEMARLSDVNGFAAISLGEYEAMRESNPWADVQFMLPAIQRGSMGWVQEAALLTSDWLEVSLTTRSSTGCLG